VSDRFCTVAREGPVTIVTINRPEVMNAMHQAAQEELSSAIDAFAADPGQWIAILTGAGDRAFSAGNDLKQQAAAGRPRRLPTGFGGITSRFDLDKPMIAAVNGLAVGGGMEMALACDLVIASENASFALPEPRVGLAALAGGIQRLGRQIGAKRAMGMILTGRQVSASEAFALGFVNEVVPRGEALSAAKRWAGEILACSPLSVRASKQALMRGLDEPSLAEALRNERDYPAARAMYESQDFIEGPKAFAEKRRPRWLGR